MSKKENTITLEDAKRFAARWRKEEGTYNAHHELHGFLIPIIDFTEVLSEKPDAVRAYVGVDDLGEEKLMMVGTRYNKETDTYEDIITDGGESAIFDFSRPCPNLCDKDSPLNK